MHACGVFNAYPDVLQHHPRHKLFRLQDAAPVQVVDGDEGPAPGLVHLAAQPLLPHTGVSCALQWLHGVSPPDRSARLVSRTPRVCMQCFHDTPSRRLLLAVRFTNGQTNSKYIKGSYTLPASNSASSPRAFQGNLIDTLLGLTKQLLNHTPT